MSFAALPPEIISARIYSGPGAGPMMAAAAAWNAIAAEMNSAATSYQTLIDRLSSEEWTGPASVSMAAAAKPYVSWMSGTAAQAEHTAMQARSAAAAYEQVYAMTVPPPVIAANRAQLMSLLRTNVLGQNTSAIAATEAQYAQMWAQDTLAMHGYQAQSTAATQFQSFSSPPNSTNPAGQAGQTSAVNQAASTAAATHAAQTLLGSPAAQTPAAGPTATTPPPNLASTILNDPGVKLFNQTLANDVNTGNLGARSICAVWRGLSGSTGYSKYAGELAKGAATAAGGAAKQAAGAASAAGAGAANAAGGLGSVSAGLGQANPLGALSVPPSWAPPAPSATALGPVSGGTWQPVGPGGVLGSVPESPPAGMPGMPGAAAGTAGAGMRGFSAPRYGAKLTVMSRMPIGG